MIDHVPVVVSDRGAEVHAYGQYYGATIARDRAAHRIVNFQDTLSADPSFEPRLLAARSSALCATRSPITSATTSRASRRSAFDHTSADRSGPRKPVDGSTVAPRPWTRSEST